MNEIRAVSKKSRSGDISVLIGIFLTGTLILFPVMTFVLSFFVSALMSIPPRESAIIILLNSIFVLFATFFTPILAIAGIVFGIVGVRRGVRKEAIAGIILNSIPFILIIGVVVAGIYFMEV